MALGPRRAVRPHLALPDGHLLLESVDQKAARIEGLGPVAAHDLHQNARLPRRHFANRVVDAHEQAAEALDGALRQLAKRSLSERAVCLVRKSHQLAMLRMRLATCAAEEHALAAAPRIIACGDVGDGLSNQLNVNVGRHLVVSYRLAAMHSETHIPAPPPLAPTLAPLGIDPRAVLDRLHESGFRFAQLSATQPGMRPRELDRSARRDLLATMRRREIEPAGIDLWIPPEHFSDPAQVDRAASAAIAAIELAADLGRVPVSVTLPVRDRGCEDASEARPAWEEAVTALIAEAYRRGVPLADYAVFTEPAAPREHNEFFGIGVDPAAWLAVGRDPAQAVTAIGSSLISARLCDLTTSGMRSPIGGSTGGGRLDVTSYKVALSIAGHERPVALDARQWDDPWSGVERSRTLWHGGG